MMPNTVTRLISKRLCGALIICLSPMIATDTWAGSCPKDKILTTPRIVENAPDQGTKRETLSLVNLTGWRGVGNLRLRTRRLTIVPGGFVPTHSHDDRPSIVYIIKGTIIEHSALCSVPIVHRAGEWTPEFGKGHRHWWKNETTEEVVLTSSDVVPPDQLDEPED